MNRVPDCGVAEPAPACAAGTGADDALAQEQAAQAALVQALLSTSAPVPSGWRGVQGPVLAGQEAGQETDRDCALQGLWAYRHNRAAHAALALAQAYPVLAQLLSEETLAALAGRYWLAHPPEGGDLGDWGDHLGPWLEGRPELAELPWLGDMARLEWAVHQAQRAPLSPAVAGHGPGSVPVPGLDLLASTDPATLHLCLAPDLQAVVSAWPVVAIWQAHQATPEATGQEEAGGLGDAEALAQRLAAVAPGASAAGVWRQGWRATVQPWPLALGPFTQALLQGRSLGQALQAHPEANFEQWLIRALQGGWLLALQVRPPE